MSDTDTDAPKQNAFVVWSEKARKAAHRDVDQLTALIDGLFHPHPVQPAHTPAENVATVDKVVVVGDALDHPVVQAAHAAGVPVVQATPGSDELHLVDPPEAAKS